MGFAFTTSLPDRALRSSSCTVTAGTPIQTGYRPESLALASRHRVIAIDLRGHGQSEKPLDAARYGDRLWRDVVELMDHLDIRRAHLHGYSLGSTVAWNVLAQNPSRIVSVALGGGGLPEVEPGWIGKLPQDEDIRAEQREQNDPDEAEASRRFRALPNRDEAALKVVLASLRRRPSIDVTNCIRQCSSSPASTISRSGKRNA